MIWVKVPALDDAPTNSGQEYENFDDFAHHMMNAVIVCRFYIQTASSSQMEELQKRSPKLSQKNGMMARAFSST